MSNSSEIADSSKDQSSTPSNQNDQDATPNLKKTQQDLDPELLKAGTQYFDSLSKYCNLELGATTSDYNLLSKMNKIITKEYGNLANSVADANVKLKIPHQHYAEMHEFLPRITQFCDSVDMLDQMVISLDKHTLALETLLNTFLENRFKQLKNLK